MPPLSDEDKDAIRGRSALRFTIPDAFEGGGGMIVECRAFEMGPRGGVGDELQLPDEYWKALLPKLASQVERLTRGEE